MITESERKRIEKEAKNYAQTLVDADSYQGTPQFICYKAGAIAEHERMMEERDEFAKVLNDLTKEYADDIEERITSKPIYPMDKKIGELPYWQAVVMAKKLLERYKQSLKR